MKRSNTKGVKKKRYSIAVNVSPEYPWQKNYDIFTAVNALNGISNQDAIIALIEQVIENNNYLLQGVK